MQVKVSKPAVLGRWEAQGRGRICFFFSDVDCCCVAFAAWAWSQPCIAAADLRPFSGAPPPPWRNEVPTAGETCRRGTRALGTGFPIRRHILAVLCRAPFASNMISEAISALKQCPKRQASARNRSLRSQTALRPRACHKTAAEEK